MLEGVVKRGTGRSIQKLGLVVAGKTGTTNDNTNGWFIGFTPDLAIGVFIGYDRPRPLGKRETGSTVAVPIFGDFVMRSQIDKPNIPFRRQMIFMLFPFMLRQASVFCRETRQQFLRFSNLVSGQVVC